MSKVVTISQIRGLPYALAVAFACAWMIDPLLIVPPDVAAAVPFSRYPHLLFMFLAFCTLAASHRWIGPRLTQPSVFVPASIVCFLCLLVFFGLELSDADVSTAVGLIICCMVSLYQATMLVACLMAFARLSMIDCMLMLIAWQFFVAIFRGAVTVLPALAVSCCAPVVIAVCLTRKSVTSLFEVKRAGTPSSSEGVLSPSSRWFPLRLILMNALVIFTIQSLLGFSSVPLTGVSYIGSLIAIALTTVVLAVNKRIVRMRQLYNASLVVMELGVIVFSMGGFVAFQVSSIMLDAAYLAFSAFFFTVLCNTCQRGKRDAVLVFSCAYLCEQIAAFSGDAMALALGSGVHALPLVALAALGAVAFTCFPTEEDYRTAWYTTLRKPKYVDPATYFYSLTEICSSVIMQYSLSKREGDVLLLAQKKTASQISDDLVVSLATVKTHIHNIYKKMGIHSKQELFDFLGLNENPGSDS